MNDTETRTQHLDLQQIPEDLLPAKAEKLSDGILEKKTEKKKRKRKAKYADYVALVKEHLGDVQRDMFSRQLMYKSDENNFWVPVDNEIDRLKSYAAQAEETLPIEYERSLFLPHIKALESESKPRLLVEIPKWDGEDRIKVLAEALQLDGTQPGFTPAVIEDILKSWCAGLFRRMKDPSFQNPVLILVGPQGVGKNVWINSLVGSPLHGGLGQFARPFELADTMRDNYAQLSRCLVLKVDEFDRMARFEQGVIKDLVFRESTNIREAYARSAADRVCKCSFIASCNNDDFYRDSSGHRRYWPINISSITWDYKRGQDEVAQVIAQAVKLFQSKYEISDYTRTVMGQFLEGKKPESFEDEILESWNIRCEEFLSTMSGDLAKKRGFVSNSEIVDKKMFESICRDHKIKVNLLRRVLRPYSRRNDKARGYGWDDRSFCDREVSEVSFSTQNDTEDDGEF